MHLPLTSFTLAVSCLLASCSSSPLVAPNETGNRGDVPSDDAVRDEGDDGAGASAPGSSAGPLATVAVYPAGPYGTARGSTIQNLSFLGWKHPDAAAYDVTQFETVRLSDFYDPDGKTGIKLLAINASAVWCGVCRAEYQDMRKNGTYEKFRAQGVEILGTLFENNSYYPAQPSDLKNWGSVSSHSVTFPLVLDPSFKMGAYFDSDATPLNMLIDVTTMKIVSLTMGYSTTYWSSTVQKLLDGL